jgi:hypothetical protein
MSPLPEKIVHRIARSLQEEELDVYVLSLYCLNAEDLNYFDPKDRERVKKIFQILMEDTQHHIELLKLIVEIGAK